MFRSRTKRGLALALLVAMCLHIGCTGGRPPADSPSGEANLPPAETPPPQKENPPSTAPKPPTMEQQIAEKIAGLTIDEKLGQLVMAGIEGTSVSQLHAELITHYKVGGILFYAKNLQTPEQSIELINDLKAENEGNPFPLLLAVDQEGGRVTRLPGGLLDLPAPKEIGDLQDERFAFRIGTILGRQLRAFGLNMNFAPVLDVNSNPDNPVIGDRSFGEDADTAASLGAAVMSGMTSENVISVVKHFPGHGDTSVDSHLALPVVNKNAEQLEALEWIPFRRAIAEGADAVMTAHLMLPMLDDQNPATLSEHIVTRQLKEKLGFAGIVITDDMTMKAITDHYDIGSAAVQAIRAGCDIVLVAHGMDRVQAVFAALKQAYDDGELTEERIDESVRKIAVLKTKYELKDEKIKHVDIQAINRLIADALETVKQ